MTQEVIIHGAPLSSYVRTALMACAEKRAPHRNEPVEFRSEAHKELHPFMKIPAMTHGQVQLFETSAIVRYLDAVFDGGTRLVPEDVVGAARAEQWVSAVNAYLYEDLVRNYVLVYLFAKGEPDRTRIDDTLPKMDRDLALLEEQLAAGPYLAGDRFSIADLFAAPIIHTAGHFPEAKAKLAQKPQIGAWIARILERESARYLAAPPPSQ